MNPGKLTAPRTLELRIRRTFLVLGALFAACYAVILPPLQAPDEIAHLDRAYGIAEGTCVAPALTPIPRSIRLMGLAFPPKLEAQRRIGSDDVMRFMHTPLEDGQDEGVVNYAANMYSCFPYIPGALGIEAGRLFSAPPAAILYLSRLANLIAYLVIVYLALGQLPGFQIPLLSVALTPMALSQAGSASWDGVAYATAFFLCAYILRLAWDPEITTLQPAHYLTLGGAIVAASLCKTDVWLAPLLILVPVSKFKSSRQKWAVFAGVVLLALMVIMGWNYVNRANFGRWIEIIKQRQIHFSDNAHFISQHPLLFLQAIIRTWEGRWVEIATEFVGKLGWLVVRLPQWAVWLYFLMLGFTSLTGTEGIRLKAAHRMVCLGVVAVSVISIFIGMWCAEVPPDYRDGVLHGVGDVPGVQGRYFIPFALPLLLVFSNTRLRVGGKWLLAIAAATIITVNAAAFEEIYRIYYLTGDTAKDFDNKLVRRSGSTADAAKIFVVRSGRKQWVLHASWFASHGYRWPDDVLIISPAQLASIPEGEPINEP